MKPLYTAIACTLLLAGVGAIAKFALAQTWTPLSRSHSNTEVTARGRSSAAAETARETGGLYAVSEDGERQVFPLKHTEVNATIAGNLSRVEVTQTFQNPFDEPLEAVYVFPLPDEAAVDDMEIKIGDRIIKGEIKEREEAQQIYEDAKREGRTAGLLEQERANIFTQSLANIKPGEQIDVTIRYTDSLQFEGGDYEFVFPMVVGPRYIPGEAIDREGNSDRVPDASRITPPVLPPEVRSGHDIGVTVEIDAGVPISEVRSPSHDLETRQLDENRIAVRLAPEDTIPNKDLILRYRVSGDNTKATVLTQGDDRGGHFAIYLIPAIDYDTQEIVPKDVVFLMDTSGSQSGDPLAKSKELMRRFINGLNPDDTFTIIDFANTAQALSAEPLENTPANRRRALSYIDKLDANGGTELLNGMQAVLNFPAAKEGRLRSVVLITDGYIGNDNEVIAEVQERLQAGNRLYSFGVGSSVNRFLLDRLAEVGRGTAQVIRQDEPTGEVADRFFRQINNPVLTNIEVAWEGGGEPAQVYPQAPPDLFAEQPLVLFGRKGDRARGQLRVRGIAAGGRRYEQLFRMTFEESGNPAIAQLWGRARIKELMSQMYGGETTSAVEAVTDTALTYRLLSQYTAFVAVSEEVRVDPDGTTRRVEVPVELPEGVSYEGIFGDVDDRVQFAPAPPPTGAMSAPSPAGMATRRAGGGVRLQQVEEEVDLATPEPMAGDRIEVLEAEGLDEAAIADLERYLAQHNFDPGLSGEVVWELKVENGRVVRVIFDDRASALPDRLAITSLRRSLSRWVVPNGFSGDVRLKLRVNKA
ncbi:after-VIT domain-containing protein [Oxynema sp. CENA135]|uniref:VIT domain-containing protein n=1 Tax=Oxynema sp. CENA135 TaxID=984206 RepID=UPI00190E1707|nr:VIT domain-containing protein [Oxynema sp. CENA135]MBK4728939.1 after-VIT domain-containing protein [Oxynema sp. CENA135]